MPCLALPLLALALGQPSDGDRIALSPATAPDQAAWEFSLGGEFPGASGELAWRDGGVLALAYDFSAGGAYVAAYRPLEPALPIAEIRFRARKAAGATLALRVTGADGQTFQKSVTTFASDWRDHVADMDGWGVSWGGSGDGILRQPVQQIGLVLDHVGLREPKGELLVSDVVAVVGSVGPVQTAFDGQYVVTDFRPESGWSADDISSREGDVWRADFSRGEAASLDHSISLFGAPRALTLTVRGGAPGSVLSLRIGSHFQTFGRRLGTLDGSEMTFTVPAPPEGWEWWGGEDDGHVYPPLRVASLLWERGDAPAEPAELSLGELRCTTALPHHRAVILHATCDGSVGEDATATLAPTCTLWNALPETVEASLHLSVLGWGGEVLAEEERAVTLPGGGARSDATFATTVPAATNYAECVLTLSGPGLRPEPSTACWTRPLEAAGDATADPSSMWGMGVYLYRYGGDAAGLAQMDRAAGMARAAGVKWTREEFQWHRMEPSAGVYDWAFYDALVDTAERHGISVYGLLAYWSGWTKPYTEEGVADYCRWVSAVVARYRGRVHYWEVWNEPNIFFWSGPKELYPVLLASAYRAVKEADPDAVVLGCSTAGIDIGFIQRCIDAQAPFDAVTVHPYRADLIEEGLIGELRRASEVAGGRRVWITEMGWPTQRDGGATERRQAELLARSYLAAAASGVCDNMGWYDFRSDGNDPFYNEHNFGVLSHDLTPKPGYRALATVCQTFAGERPGLVEGMPPGVLAASAGGATALWTTDAGGTLPCVVEGGPIEVRDLMGEAVASVAEGQTLTLELTRAPLFLTGRGSLRPTGPLASTGGGGGGAAVHF